MTDSSNGIRILIADEHPVVRFGIRQLLEDDPLLRVVAEAGTPEEVEAALSASNPDIILLDPCSTRFNGDDFLRRLASVAANASVIIFTAHAEREQVVSALKSGARSYLLKQTDLQTLRQDIKSACTGTAVLSPGAASTLVEHIHNEDSVQDSKANNLLSAREIQVLGNLALGMSNRAIAESLSICEATVKFHVHAILEKLEASNRTEAVMLAVERGLVHL